MILCIQRDKITLIPVNDNEVLETICMEVNEETD